MLPSNSGECRVLPGFTYWCEPCDTQYLPFAYINILLFLQHPWTTLKRPDKPFPQAIDLTRTAREDVYFLGYTTGDSVLVDSPRNRFLIFSLFLNTSEIWTQWPLSHWVQIWRKANYIAIAPWSWDGHFIVICTSTTLITVDLRICMYHYSSLI
jgi:hypothetical protein